MKTRLASKLNFEAFWIQSLLLKHWILNAKWLIAYAQGPLLGILGPMKRNLIGPLYRPAKKCDAALCKTVHFNDIFDYHSYICEKNNITFTWLLLIVSLVVPHAGLIYLHNCRLTGGGIGFGVKKYIYEAIWFLRFNLLIFRKYNHFSDCFESCI